MIQEIFGLGELAAIRLAGENKKRMLHRPCHEKYKYSCTAVGFAEIQSGENIEGVCRICGKEVPNSEWKILTGRCVLRPSLYDSKVKVFVLPQEDK